MRKRRRPERQAGRQCHVGGRSSATTFKRGKYEDVILPLTGLRRLDWVVAAPKRKVVTVQARFKGMLDKEREFGRACGSPLQHGALRLREAGADAPPHRAEPAQLRAVR